MSTDLSITIAGEAGQGSRATASIIAKTLSRAGYRVFVYEDYQSLIRGGHNFVVIRASEKEVLTHKQKSDFLVALNEDAVTKHKKNLKEDSRIIYNSDKISLEKENTIGIPASAIVKEAGGSQVMTNTALTAGLIKALDLNIEEFKQVLKEEFGEESNEKNTKIADKAFEQTESILHLKTLQKQARTTLLTGNQAAALGAVKAGLTSYFAYPMTPSTGILHFLAENKSELNVAVSQPENEISVINMALGAAYSGSRTMVGTSGGGFALMNETLSMATISELPVVIVESQRMSPASGVPTYNGQGDLLYTLNAGHGDIVRFLAAPGDAEETYEWAGKLMNLSWKYQTPSILLMDKHVSESSYELKEKTLDKIKFESIYLSEETDEYNRYKITDEGVSPLAFPGEAETAVKSNSYEHDEKGITTEDPEEIVQMQEKRLLKFQKMREKVEEMEAVKTYGSKDAKRALLVWGSTKGAAVEAVEEIGGFKLIQIVVVEPFPKEQVAKALEKVEELIVVETNSLGQMSQVLRCNGIYPDRQMLKYNARPFTPEEIVESLKE